MLYYRQLYNLLPGSALRRSETHLARQIFNGLTRINEENGELESDLSHHWQALTPLHWRFYLRPAIHFIMAVSWRWRTSSLPFRD